MADPLADQIVAGDRDQPGRAHVPEPLQHLRHAQRNRGLAGAGISGEAHVQARRSRGDAELAARTVDEEQRRDLTQPRLHRGEPHQLAAERLEHFLDAGAREELREIDGRLVLWPHAPAG